MTEVCSPSSKVQLLAGTAIPASNCNRWLQSRLPFPSPARGNPSPAKSSAGQAPNPPKRFLIHLWNPPDFFFFFPSRCFSIWVLVFSLSSFSGLPACYATLSLPEFVPSSSTNRHTSRTPTVKQHPGRKRTSRFRHAKA
ncbi:hypothetical protein VTK26DRAFT_245 [Humicola hyalothermophila]